MQAGRKAVESGRNLGAAELCNQQTFGMINGGDYMQSLWFLWDVLINVLEWVFSFLLLRQKLGYSKSHKKWIVVATVVLIIVQTIMNYNGTNNRVVMVCMYVLSTIYALALFKGTPAMRIMWASAISVVFILANLLVYLIVTQISAVDIQIALTPSVSRIGPTTLYIVICFALFMLLMKYPNIRIDLPQDLQFIIIVVSVVCAILAGQLQGAASDPAFSDSEHILYLFASLTLTVFLLGFFFVIHRTGEFFLQDAESKDKLRSMALERKNNEQMQKVIEAWNHDQHHHIAVMYSYVSKKDIDGMCHYLHEMQEDLEAVTTLINTGNQVLDAILSSKLRLCKSEHILFKVRAKDIGRLPLSDTDLSSLIGNILDNAFEGCQNCRGIVDNVFIDFQVIRQHGMVIISAVNSAGGKYQYDNNQLQSTKRGKGHGYGLKRIKQIVEDAGGFVDIKPSGDRFKIEVCIPDINGGKQE